jgi:hypothetical protein
MHFSAESKTPPQAGPSLGLAGKTMIGNNFKGQEIGMTLGIFRISRVARGFFLIVLLAAGAADVAKAGLSEAERITLDQPACARMKTFSQDITLLNDELQNVRKFGQRNRMCDVLGRAANSINGTLGYMQSHIGECTITTDSIERLSSQARDFERDRRKLCR